MSDKNKVFSEWEEVKCNECENYWVNACDGVPVDKRRLCNSFIANRSVSIPKEIDKLQNQLLGTWIVGGIITITLITFVVYIYASL